MRTCNLDKVLTYTITDGTIILFAKPEDLIDLEIFLLEKSREIFLYIFEKVGDQEINRIEMKVPFNYDQRASIIIQEIANYMNGIDD